MKKWFIVLLIAGMSNSLQAAECGGLTSHYGPYDYTNPVHKSEKLPIVERYHFNSDVENLVSGMSGYVHDDLHYTLITFPNHHRALHAMARYQMIKKRPPGADYYTADCYFRRAMRFRPKDAMSKMLYAVYLHRLGKRDKALEMYKLAEKLRPNSTEIKYNLGLLYLDMKKYDDALLCAQFAYDRGYPLPGLRDRLKRKGKWKKARNSNKNNN